MHASLIGAAGVYFVTSRLNAMDLHCPPTFGSVPNVDILVSNSDGTASLSLQVKTTMHALREKGRGTDRKPHHYEWDIGWHCARLRAPNLLFALVVLKGFPELPDVFIVPSKVIADYLDPNCVAPSGMWSRKPRRDPWLRARYHELVEALGQYKNNWAPMLQLNQREQHAT